jgi:hypothetical protein
MNGLSAAARAELEALRLEKGGTLIAADVVDQARSPNSALHPYFEWGDDKAAELYREQQARSVIRAVVRIMPNGNGNPVAVRAYVSLPDDRANRTGYRAVADVMNDDDLAAKALQAFEADVLRLEAKYQSYALIRPTIAEAVAQMRRVLAPS